MPAARRPLCLDGVCDRDRDERALVRQGLPPFPRDVAGAARWHQHGVQKGTKRSKIDAVNIEPGSRVQRQSLQLGRMMCCGGDDDALIIGAGREPNESQGVVSILADLDNDHAGMDAKHVTQGAGRRTVRQNRKQPLLRDGTQTWRYRGAQDYDHARHHVCPEHA